MYIDYQQRSQTTNDGFTLIELLLAVFIASLVLAVLYASFFQIIKVKEKVELELELYHEARVIFSKMTRDLVTAFPRGAVNTSETIASDYFLGTQENDFSELRFTSLARFPGQNVKESDQTEISYFIEPVSDDDPELFALIRRDDPTIGTEGGGLQYPISERVVKFTVSYLNQPLTENQEPVFEWDSNATSALPKALDVNIVLRSPSGYDEEFNSLILIPVAN